MWLPGGPGRGPEPPGPPGEAAWRFPAHFGVLRGRLGAVLGRLGAVLERSWGYLGFFYRFLSDLLSENRSPNLGKSLNSIGKIIFLAFRLFSHKMASGCDVSANMVPFWFPKSSKIASWRPLGASCGRLGAPCGRLGASWDGLKQPEARRIDF